MEKRRFHLHPYVTYVEPGFSSLHYSALFSSDYLEKFFAEQELQLTTTYEQSSTGFPLQNPPLSNDPLAPKRRLSSELFLKPMSTIKRPKPLLNSNETNEQRDLEDNQQLLED